MFDETFSWDTSRSPSVDSSNAPSTRQTSRSVSPCSQVGPFPPPRFSVTDLAAQLADSRMRQESRIYHDSCDAYAANDDDAGWAIEPATEEENLGMAPVRRSRTRSLRPPRPHSPSQRSQRQANARLLCSSAHRQELAALVSRMVESNDQCSVADAPLSLSPTVDEDGYGSSDDLTPVQSRRSSIAPNGRRVADRRPSEARVNGANISKSTRFNRRDRGLSRVRTLDKA